MTEATENTEIKQTETVEPAESKVSGKTYTEAEVEELVNGLKNQRDKLLDEKKSAAKKAEEAEKRAAKEAEERAKQENDYQSLYESSQSKAKEYEEKYTGLQQKIRAEKRSGEALKLASQMASGKNTKLLSTFIEDRIDINDGGEIIVLDEKGGPTVSTIEDLKKEFLTSGDYDALIDGTKSSGGAVKPTGRAGGDKAKEAKAKGDLNAFLQSKLGN